MNTHPDVQYIIAKQHLRERYQEAENERLVRMARGKRPSLFRWPQLNLLPRLVAAVRALPNISAPAVAIGIGRQSRPRPC